MISKDYRGFYLFFFLFYTCLAQTIHREGKNEEHAKIEKQRAQSGEGKYAAEYRSKADEENGVSNEMKRNEKQDDEMIFLL